MNRQTIRAAVIETLEADIGADFSGLEEAKYFRTELGLDSVDVVSVISQIELKFRIRFTQQELEGPVTVGDLLTLLESKIGPGASNQAA